MNVQEILSGMSDVELRSLIEDAWHDSAAETARRAVRLIRAKQAERRSRD